MLTAAVLTACGKADENSVPVALITEQEGIEAGSVMQEIWLGIEDYRTSYGERTGYYAAQASTTEAYLAAIGEAVEKGARTVVLHGEEAEAAVYEAQTVYKKVEFLLLEAEPQSEDGTQKKMRKNTKSIFFDKIESGFLAGYAAVAEGYTQLVYINGKEKADSREYAAGFLQGAQAAAKAMGKGSGAVSVHWLDRETDGISPSFYRELKTLYANGVQAAYTDGGSYTKLVFEVAKETGRAAIGNFINAGTDHENVVVSSVVNYRKAVSMELEAIEKDAFQGGSTTVYGVAENGVALTMGTARLQNFTKEAYRDLLLKVADGSFEIKGTDILEQTAALDCLRIEVSHL